MNGARFLGSAVSLAAGLDKPGHVAFNADPDAPLDPHESHEWVQHDRWAECATCGMRDYYPGASVECIGPAKPSETSISLSEAIALLAIDLERFREWWQVKGHEKERPTLAEWAAEWYEWRRASTGRGKKRKT